MKRNWLLMISLILCCCCFIGFAEADTLVIPDSVEEIEAEAFANDSALDEVILPEGLSVIGSRAFANSSLQRIYLPFSLNEIAKDAFSGCKNVSAYGVPHTYAAEWCEKNKIPFEAISTPAEEFSFKMTSSTEATITKWNGNGNIVCIPEMADETHRITVIGSEAFRKKAIQVVVLSSGIREISTSAFRDCSALQNMYFNDSLTEISHWAFCKCTALTNVDIPDSVTTLGMGVFNGCTSLASFHYPQSLTKIDGGGETVSPFREVPLITRIVIPDGITMIPDYMFAGCDQITEIIIPDSVTTIGQQAFRGCSALKEIILPPELEIIETSTFWGCTALQNVHFNDGLTEISHWAFKKCAALTDIDIPDSVTTLGMGVFNGCTSLTSFHYPQNLIKIDGVGETVSPFREVPLITQIVIPDGITMIPDYMFAGCDQITEIIIPDSVTTIGEGAFRNCSALTEINLPPKLKAIETSTFRNCSALKNVSMGNEISIIDSWAFQKCSALPWLYVPTSVTKLGIDVFDKCDKLTVESEYGATVIDYCEEKSISYYYLSLIACNFPRDTVVQGSDYKLFGKIISTVNLTNVRLVLTNLDSGSTIADFSRNPAAMSYQLESEASGVLDIANLPLGSYKLTISSATGLTSETFAECVFRVIEPPLRASVEECVFPGDSMSVGGLLPMSGTLRTNYPIKSVSVSVVNTASGTVVASCSTEPGTVKYIYLDGLAKETGSISEIGNYKVTISLTAHNETIIVYEGFICCVNQNGEFPRSTQYENLDYLFTQDITANLNILKYHSANLVYTMGNSASIDLGFHVPNSKIGNNTTLGRSAFTWKDVDNGNGKLCRVYAIAIHGTDDSVSQWVSNADLGTSSLHAGFNQLAQAVWNYLQSYISQVEKDNPKETGKYGANKYWIAGHSRGAAAANILGGSIMPGNNINKNDIYCFCFACPNVKTSGDSYAKQIRVYNIAGDIVPQVPLKAWGYGVYGVRENEYNAASIRSDSGYILINKGEELENAMEIMSAILGKGALENIKIELQTAHITSARGYIDVLLEHAKSLLSGEQFESENGKAFRLFSNGLSLFGNDIERQSSFFGRIVNTHEMKTYLNWMKNY